MKKIDSPIVKAVLVLIVVVGSFSVGMNTGARRERAIDTPILDQLREENTRLADDVETQKGINANINTALQTCQKSYPASLPLADSKTIPHQ